MSCRLLVVDQIATITWRVNRFSAPIADNSRYVIVARYLSRTVPDERGSKRRYSVRDSSPRLRLVRRLFPTIPETCSPSSSAQVTSAYLDLDIQHHGGVSIYRKTRYVLESSRSAFVETNLFLDRYRHRFLAPVFIPGGGTIRRFWIK